MEAGVSRCAGSTASLNIELKTKKLVKLEPKLRLLERHRVCRAVDSLKGLSESHKTIPLTHILGHIVRNSIGVVIQNLADNVVHALCTECCREFLCCGVYALQSATLLARQSHLYRLNLWMNKAQLTAVERRTTKNKVLATQLKLILNPLYAPKPDKLSLARLVGNVDNKTLISPLAKVILARHATTNLYVATRTVRLV